MDVTLVTILDVDKTWEMRHRIRALAIKGKSLARSGLDELKRNHPEDYKKLMNVMRQVGASDRVRNRNHVKQGKQYTKVFEMRGGHARMFFFYTPDEREIVVCTNQYLKTKPSRKEQNAAFELCERLRRLYYESIGAKP